ncbi:DNA polymerase Y family protein [Georgenia subflava]|uniref:DNA polymerase Y family protein n=1 Tax=Georgenia subflava TaxID=1622177 RepID=A0A6N7EF13_9MICO|nr:DNA polymerase Y family protein [Georgenia subflava]MPV35763.1 DNA polymerase Y family protein [Georgenia subflava]
MAAVEPGRAARRAVLWVPDWPVAAAVAEGLVDPQVPVAVHDNRGVVVASAPARAAGVRRGMRRRSAQQLCPELVLLPADPVRDARAFEPLVQAVETVVADVEVVRPGMVVFLARGPVRHVGSEEILAELLVGTVATETGAECQVGIGDGLLAAMLAARAGVLVPAGTTPAFLAGQDVAALTLAASTRQATAETAELVDLLRRLGLRTLGAFAALATGDVAARFGTHGLGAHRLARGLDVRPPVSRRPEDDVLAATELDPPAERSDVAAFAARSLAEQLAERMLRRGVVCARLQVAARTEDGTELVRTWSIDDAPTAAELTDRVRWQLEGWLSGRSGRPPSAPLTHLELEAQEVSPAGAVQDGLWGRSRRGEAQASRAALRVQGLLGAEGVLVPVLQGGRDPRAAARLVAWGDEAAPLRRTDAPWPGQVPAPWPATVPTEPVPARLVDAVGAEVRVDARGTTSGAPARVVVLPHAPTAAPGPVEPGEYPLLAWAGPWHGTERWWSGQGRRRAYVQVVPDGAPALLLALEQGAWRVEGVYD